MSTIVTFLLDKSGSMAPIQGDTIGAVNAYVSTLQKEPSGITFSLLQFNTSGIETTCKNVGITQAPLLTNTNYHPEGGTPLIDAAYATIKGVEQAIGMRDDSPKVVVCIQTDGQENSSSKYTTADLKALIEEKQALGWQFNFMGCGIDAYDQAARFGIGHAQTVSYGRDKSSITAAFSVQATNTADFAAGRVGSTAYSNKQKAAMGDTSVPPDLVGTTTQPKPKTAASDAPDLT